MTWLRPTARAQARSHGLSVLVALVVAVTSSLLCAVPALAADTAADHLTRLLREGPPPARTVSVTVTMDLFSLPSGVHSRIGAVPDPFAEVADVVTSDLDRAGGHLFGRPETLVTTVRRQPLSPAPPGSGRRVSLVISPTATQQVRWTSGRAPQPRHDRSGGPDDDPPETAVSDATARAWGLRTGQVVRFGAPAGIGGIPLRLVGTYTPVDPASDFWAGHPDLVAPVRSPGAEGTLAPHAGLLLATGEHPALADHPMTRKDLRYEWVAPVDVERVRPADIRALATGLAELNRSNGDELLGAQVSTGVGTTLATWRDAVVGSRAVDDALTTGVLVLSLALLLLLVLLRTEQREHTLRLLQTRGASLGQVAALGAVDLLGAAALGGALGWAAASLVAQRPAPAGPAVVLPVVVAVLSAVAAVRAVLGAAPELTGGRRRLAAAGRLAPAAVLLLTTVLGVSVILTREPTPRRTTAMPALTDALVEQLAADPPAPDPLASAAPSLVVLVAALAGVWVLLTLVRITLPSARRAHGAAVWLGLTQLARSTSASRLPLVALAVSAATCVLGTTVWSTLVELPRQYAAAQVMADVSVTGSAVDETAAERIAALPGVVATATTASRIADVQAGEDRAGLRLVAVRSGDLDATLGSGPAPVGSASSAALELLRRPGVQVLLGGRPVPLDAVVRDPRLDRLGSMPSFRIRPGTPVDLSGSVTTVLVGVAPGQGSAVAERVAGLVPTAVVEERGAVKEAFATTPFARHTRLVAATTTLAAGALAAVGAYALVAATAGRRRRLLARTRILGLPARGRRTAVLVELLPAATGAVVLGLAAGLALPVALPRIVDLSAVIGGPTYPALTPSTAGTALAAAAAGLPAAAALLLDLREGRSSSLSRHLRSGDHG